MLITSGLRGHFRKIGVANRSETKRPCPQLSSAGPSDSYIGSPAVISCHPCPPSNPHNYVSSFCNDVRNILITGSHKSSHLIHRGSLSSQRTLWTGSAVFPGDFHILLCGFLLLVPCSHSAATMFRGPGFKRLPIFFIIIMLWESATSLHKKHLLCRCFINFLLSFLSLTKLT